LVYESINFPGFKSGLSCNFLIKLFVLFVVCECDAKYLRYALDALIDRDRTAKVRIINIHPDIPAIFLADTVELF